MIFSTARFLRYSVKYVIPLTLYQTILLTFQIGIFDKVIFVNSLLFLYMHAGEVL